jgi:hypothetical protein
MDRITNLALTVQREVEDYVRGKDLKAVSYAVSDVARQIYVAIVVPDRPRPFPARVIVMARVVDDIVIIDEDTTDRPLWEELVRAGIPRDQIVCLYAGEEIPASKGV